MNQYALYVFLLSAGSFQFAAGQADTAKKVSDQAVIAMTRATLNFLATDTKTYGYNKTSCRPCETYEELRQFVKTNKLMRADELIADVQKKATTLSPTELRTYLLKRVTEGAAHAHRTKLPRFADYQQALDAAAGVQTVSLAKPEVSNDNLTTGGTDTVDAPTSTDENITKQSDASVNPPPSMTTWFSIAALILSLLSLAGVIILWFRKQPSSDTPSVSPDAQLSDLKTKITRLEAGNAQLKKELDALKKEFDKQDGSAVIQSPVMPATPPSSPDLPIVSPPKIASVPASPAANTFRPPQPAMPTLFYGRTADLGDGFSVGGLSAKPDRDTVFEIRRIDNGRAEFQVSDSPDLQRLALSDPYSYLNDTCTYATQPRPGSRIQTARPGTLSLQGEKWAITEKAQISFQ